MEIDIDDIIRRGERQLAFEAEQYRRLHQDDWMDHALVIVIGLSFLAMIGAIVLSYTGNL